MMFRIPKVGKIIKPFTKKYKLRKAAWKNNEIDKISSSYSMGNWHFQKVFSGGNSYNILVETDQGKKVLKKYIWDVQSTIYEHSVIQYLKTIKLPVPQLILNNSGMSFTNLDSGHYALYEYLEGYCPDDYHMSQKSKINFTVSAGLLFGQLHAETMNFTPDGKKLNGYTPDGNRLYRDLQWHIDVVNRYLKLVNLKGVQNERDQFLVSILEDVKSKMADAIQSYLQPNSILPKLIIHGDYTPHNFLLRGDEIIGLLDFEGACLNLRAEDLSYALFAFCWNEDNGIDGDMARPFMEGYRQRQHLSNVEIGAIPDILRWIFLRKIVRPLYHMVNANLEKHVRGDGLQEFKYKYRMVGWFEENRDKLLSILR